MAVFFAGLGFRRDKDLLKRKQCLERRVVLSAAKNKSERY